MTDKPTKGAERERRLDMAAYLTDEYFSFNQLWSYAEQIHHIIRMKPTTLLEVGIGNGFVASFLRSAGIDVTTCDINPRLRPDIVASVTELDSHVSAGDYEMIVCCEVLEHMPFAAFAPAIRMFASLSPKLFLTLPVSGAKVGFGMFCDIAGHMGWWKLWWYTPLGRSRVAEMHYWEIGSCRETRLPQILRILRSHYATVDSGPMIMNPYHRWFRCHRSER